MCLNIKTAETKKIKAILEKGPATFWKTVKLHGFDTRATSISQRKPLPNKGLYISNRDSVRLTEQERSRSSIDYGIHVFTAKPKPSAIVSGYILVSMICRKEDFVAAGYNSGRDTRGAVFKKVTVGPEIKDHLAKRKQAKDDFNKKLRKTVSVIKKMLDLGFVAINKNGRSIVKLEKSPNKGNYIVNGNEEYNSCLDMNGDEISSCLSDLLSGVKFYAEIKEPEAK